MNDLSRIERDVAALSPKDFARFRAWFDALEAERFDRRIAEDADAGRLDALADAALAEHRAGKTRPL